MVCDEGKDCKVSGPPFLDLQNYYDCAFGFSLQLWIDVGGNLYQSYDPIRPFRYTSRSSINSLGSSLSFLALQGMVPINGIKKSADLTLASSEKGQVNEWFRCKLPILKMGPTKCAVVCCTIIWVLPQYKP